MKNMMKLKNENFEKELKRHAAGPECLNSKTSHEDSEDTSKMLNNTADFCIKEVK